MTNVVQRRRDDDETYGFAESTNYIAKALGSFVPAFLARRAISVEVSTDEPQYEPGEPIAISIKFENRLPVPVTVTTQSRRLWGWTVNGELAASDEPRYRGGSPGEFAFDPGERKRVSRTWNGQFKRTDGRTRWESAGPGEYEIAAFLATPDERPRDTTTVRIGR